MKFTLTIQDLEADEAFDVLEKLGGLETYRNIPAAPVFESSQNRNIPASANIFQVNKTGNEAEFDSKGFPWDERIHAGTKSKNADGQWKKKKGADEATIAAVEAELKGRVSESAPVAAPVEMSIPVAPAAPVAPVAMPVAAPVAAPVVMAAPIQRDFKGLLQHISNLFQTKSITPNYPDTIVVRINEAFKIQMATITDVATDPRHIEYAWQCIDVDGKGLAA